MDYLNYLLQKWMPPQQRVAVDSSPSLHGIWDTINTTLATPPGSITRLPPEFYDRKAHKIIESIVVEEEYAGYKESEEYRTVGIGALLGEVVRRMQYWIQREYPQIRTPLEILAIIEAQILTHGEERKGPNFALAGCHDSTLAAILASMGAMKGENNKWPQYTSSLAVELFSSDVIDSARIEKNEGKGKRASPDTALRQITLNFPASPSATIKNQDPEQDSPDNLRFMSVSATTTVPSLSQAVRSRVTTYLKNRASALSYAFSPPFPNISCLSFELNAEISDSRLHSKPLLINSRRRIGRRLARRI